MLSPFMCFFVSVFVFGCTRCAAILRYITRQLASCRRCFGMITPSLSAADIFSVLDELGRSTRVPLWPPRLSVRVG